MSKRKRAASALRNKLQKQASLSRDDFCVSVAPEHGTWADAGRYCSLALWIGDTKGLVANYGGPVWRYHKPWFTLDEELLQTLTWFRPEALKIWQLRKCTELEWTPNKQCSPLELLAKCL